MPKIAQKISNSLNDPKIKRASYSNIKGKDKSTAEFSALQFLWKFSVWAQRTGFNRPIIHIPVVLRDLFCIPLGHVMLGKKKKKIMTGLKILYPNLSFKRKKQIVSSYLSYMGKLMYDMMFCIPIVADTAVYKKYIKDENLHYLDEALEQGKGAILAIIHTGNLFHSLIGVSFQEMTNDPTQRYSTAILAARDNDAMYKPVTEKYEHIDIIVTAPFSELKDHLLDHLSKNHVVMLYYDFSSPKQLATPFMSHKNSFLKPTPQSIASLHRISGAPIIPMVTIPQGEIQKSVNIYLDPQPLNELSQKLKNADKKEYHGQMSLALNKMLHPYIAKLTHVWEELMAFSTYIFKVKVSFEKNLTLSEFISSMQLAMEKVVNDTYEPGRDETKLFENISLCCKEALENLVKPTDIFNEKNSYYRYYDRTSSLQLKKLAKLSIFQLNKRNEKLAAQAFQKLIDSI